MTEKIQVSVPTPGYGNHSLLTLAQSASCSLMGGLGPVALPPGLGWMHPNSLLPTDPDGSGQ